jgi:hypothetical protein
MTASCSGTGSRVVRPRCRRGERKASGRLRQRTKGPSGAGVCHSVGEDAWSHAVSDRKEGGEGELGQKPRGKLGRLMGQAWPGGGKDGPQDRELGRRDWVETRSTAWHTTWVGKEKESWSGWFGKKKR